MSASKQDDHIFDSDSDDEAVASKPEINNKKKARRKGDSSVVEPFTSPCKKAKKAPLSKEERIEIVRQKNRSEVRAEEEDSWFTDTDEADNTIEPTVGAGTGEAVPFDFDEDEDDDDWKPNKSHAKSRQYQGLDDTDKENSQAELAWIDKEVQKYLLTSDGNQVPPPWAEYPHTHPYEMFWRMGGGESFSMVFHRWWERQQMDENERIAYFRKYPPPPRWLDSMITLLWDLEPAEYPEADTNDAYFERAAGLGFGTKQQYIIDLENPVWLEN